MNLHRKVRYQLRKTPELTFYLDDSLDYLENIDNLLTRDKEAHPGRLDDAVAEGNHDA